MPPRAFELDNLEIRHRLEREGWRLIKSRGGNHDVDKHLDKPQHIPISRADLARTRRPAAWHGTQHRACAGWIR
ncbi:hypothetical protein Y590_16205 [Methylobacterium sp. AMS5]|nr:hypothetical protein Y590_16205 [Methylobacterium sp. AMS5]